MREESIESGNGRVGKDTAIRLPQASAAQHRVQVVGNDLKQWIINAPVEPIVVTGACRKSRFAVA